MELLGVVYRGLKLYVLLLLPILIISLTILSRESDGLPSREAFSSSSASASSASSKSP